MFNPAQRSEILLWLSIFTGKQGASGLGSETICRQGGIDELECSSLRLQSRLRVHLPSLPRLILHTPSTFTRCQTSSHQQPTSSTSFPAPFFFLASISNILVDILAASLRWGRLGFGFLHGFQACMNQQPRPTLLHLRPCLAALWFRLPTSPAKSRNLHLRSETH